jgi:hypothetical protein
VQSIEQNCISMQIYTLIAREARSIFLDIFSACLIFCSVASPGLRTRSRLTNMSLDCQEKKVWLAWQVIYIKKQIWICKSYTHLGKAMQNWCRIWISQKKTRCLQKIAHKHISHFIKLKQQTQASNLIEKKRKGG